MYENFISHDERLDDVLRRDADILQSYGITTKIISDFLQNIVDTYKYTKNYVDSNSEFDIIINEKMLLPQNISKAPVIADVSKFEPKIIDNKFLVISSGTKICQQCAFSTEKIIRYRDDQREEGAIFFRKEGLNCGKGYGSVDYVIHNIKTGKNLRFGDLLIHMIRDHSFFEGNVCYRLDPHEVIGVLELKSE